jgi:DNA-directed RNA polymerase specialized sigma24 family protein
MAVEEEKFYFCEECALLLFQRWKATEDLRVLNELLLACLPIVERLISLRASAVYESPDELKNLALLRLAKGFRHWYNPERGRIFTFVTKTTEHGFVDAVRRRKRSSARYVSMEDFFTNSLAFSVNGQEHGEALDDLHYRIRRIKTLSACPYEREAQRWLVKNLVASNFVFRRHEASDAMTIVYGLSPERSRKLYDITLLAIRRELIDERTLKPVSVSDLIGTRGRALLRYRAELTPIEFSRLAYLMRNLAPAIIETGEFSLREVLYGSPRETPLFVTNTTNGGLDGRS